VSNPRLSIIPAGAVTDRSLEPRDLQALCLLGRHTDKAGWCVRSQVKMAQELDCSRASLQNSLDRLCGAGWIEKKRRDIEVEEAGKHPSRSYAYRVVLDRDDYAFENAAREAEDGDSESYAENASEEGGCQPVGTPLPTEQHPGANACVGTRANTYVGTNNDPLERPPLERERDARARDRSARFLVAFEQRWPTAAADDRQRTAYAAEALNEEEQQAALAGIGPFLEHLRRVGRKNVPAGWRYLEEKRWTLLDHGKPATSGPAVYPRDSAEARGVKALHEIAGRISAFWKIYHQSDGSVAWGKTMTPQLAALGQAPPPDQWVTLDRNGGGAWEAFMQQFFDQGVLRNRMREGSRAPWAFPPSATGKIYDGKTGPPGGMMTAQDEADFK
jgi:hypothetical protein